MIRYAMLPLFVIACAGEAFAQPQAADSLLSPRLRTLLAAAAGDTVDTTDVWAAIVGSGSPTIEPAPDSSDDCIVTFLYRGGSDTRSVAVIGLENHQLANDRYFALARMRRLPRTDIWFRSYRLPSDARFTYRLSVNDESLFADLTPAEWSARVRALKIDSLNAARTHTRDGQVSLVELPRAPSSDWIRVVPGRATGVVDSATLDGSALPPRNVRVYRPPVYGHERRTPDLLIYLDGEDAPAAMPIPTILDNLIAEHRIAPVLAVFVENIPGRRIADLAYSDSFLAFVRDDLLPWIHRNYNVTSDPARTIIAGRSFSGGAAAWLALELPHVFGNVLSQSGGFATRGPAAHTQPTDHLGFAETGFPEGEWLTRQYALLPRRPLRFYIEVGTFEDVAWEFPFPQYATPTVLVANRHLRDVLNARGYENAYREYNGPHDPLSWRQTFGAGVLWLIGRD